MTEVTKLEKIKSLLERDERRIQMMEAELVRLKALNAKRAVMLDQKKTRAF